QLLEKRQPARRAAWVCVGRHEGAKTAAIPPQPRLLGLIPPDERIGALPYRYIKRQSQVALIRHLPKRKRVIALTEIRRPVFDGHVNLFTAHVSVRPGLTIGVKDKIRIVGQL